MPATLHGSQAWPSDGIMPAAPRHPDEPMNSAQTLGALHNLHGMMNALLQQIPTDRLLLRPQPDIPSLGWQFGRAMYLETYLIDEKVVGDDNLSRRVRHLFAHDVTPTPSLEAQLPPSEHLLNWALDIQDRHLTLLANPGQLPAHPWLEDGWLTAYLVQAHGRAYEDMLACLAAHALNDPTADYRPSNILELGPVCPSITELSQGHYRIGARDGVVFDNELPTQMVELSNYRIAEQPISNAAWLAFMADDGYATSAWWDEEGWQWRETHRIVAPLHWRESPDGNWYGIGLNGPFDLLADAPVSGLSLHEARAFACWAASRPGLEGAVLQHEYQWELASRTRSIQGLGQVREWCSNPFVPYDQYEQPRDPELASRFSPGLTSLRGASIHTQPQLRRDSMRYGAAAGTRHPFCGARLVFPPRLID